MVNDILRSQFRFDQRSWCRNKSRFHIRLETNLDLRDTFSSVRIRFPPDSGSSQSPTPIEARLKTNWVLICTIKLHEEVPQHSFTACSIDLRTQIGQTGRNLRQSSKTLRARISLHLCHYRLPKSCTLHPPEFQTSPKNVCRSYCL